MEGDEDHALWERMGDDDQRAWRRYVDRHLAVMLTVAGRCARGDAALRDELLQELLIALWRQSKTREPIPHFAAWCSTVARHSMITSARKRQRTRPLEPGEAEGLGADPHESLEARSAMRRIERGFADLSERDLLLLTRHLDGESVADIAREDLSHEGAPKAESSKRYKAMHEQVRHRISTIRSKFKGWIK